MSPFWVEGDRVVVQHRHASPLLGIRSERNRQLRRANEIPHPLAMVLVTPLNVQLASTR